MLDQLRKEADRVNSLRHNNVGVNLTYKTYADSIDARQAALEKQLEAGIKAGTLLEDEAKVIRGYLDDANNLEAEYGADGRIDWKDHNRLSTALNSAEIQLYDLQRNDFGKKLKASYVDVVHADKRQAQQLESIARGISNKSLTDDEAIATLQAQKGIQGMENDFIKGDDGKLDRGEYLRLQSAMNTFDLANHEAQTNSARWNGILKASAAAVTPAAPVPAASAPVPPVAAEKPAPAPVAAEKPAPAPVPPVASVPAPSPAPTPVTGEAKVEWHAGNALTMQAYDAKADKWIDVASKGRGESAAFNTTVKLSQDMLDGGRFRIVDGGTILENGRKSTNADGSVTIRFNDTGADQDFNDALITFKPSASNAPAPAPVVAPAPAAASAPAAEVKPEVKAEATQEAPSVSEQVRSETKSETQPTTAQINRELAREGNHFGDMMVKAMEAQSENLRKVHDELSHEAEKSHSDRESNDNHVKREAKSNVWVPENKGLELHGNAETERQVAAYAAAAASTAKYEPPIAKKVA